jgi:serine/threonine-protein kinase RsbW
VRKVVIRTSLRAARRVANQVLKEVRSCGYREEATFAIKLAMEEALINAIKHGNRGDLSKSVIVEFEIDPREAVLQVTDEGEGFRPEKVPDPTADENLECPSGRGVMLMKAYMDEVKFSSRGNTVRMVRRNT